jgi:pimeloyl-ACP methyl ester carboxylesterase
MRSFCFVPLLAISLCTLAQAANHEADIPLDNGRLRSETLTSEALKKLHLPGIGFGSYSLDVSDWRDSDFVHAVNKSLAGACRVEISKDNLYLELDPARLPHCCDDTKQVIRSFTATVAPNAAARQQRSWGLLLPRSVDDNKRLVVLVHGLDCNRSNWGPMADLLKKDGYQVAYFTYPSDGPVKESVAMLAQEMTGVHETFPNLRISFIAHSMGGLVARAYVEGDRYAGNVDHLIMLGTPNQGSRWAAYRVGLEFREHWGLWKTDPDWSPAWIITDGLGEAGRDLKPHSAFLTDLNSRPRRAGVHYTIVAGNYNLTRRLGADAVDSTASVIPNAARSWWGVKQTAGALDHWSSSLRNTAGKSDGPVTIKSTQLAGVDDFIVISADHNSLYYPTDGAHAPAAWSIIHDRLAR